MALGFEGALKPEAGAEREVLESITHISFVLDIQMPGISFRYLPLKNTVWL